MAGAGKRRQKTEATASSCGEPSSSGNKTESSGSGGQRASPEHSSPRSSPSSLPGYDGNRDPTAAQLTIDSRSARNALDSFGIAAFYAARGIPMPDSLPGRPAKLNMQGREVKVRLNTFSVDAMPVKTVYQYDVVVGSGDEKRGLTKAVWESKTVRSKLGDDWLFDGNKIAWSHQNMKELNLVVDLDAERGREVRPDRKGRNKHRFHLRPTKKLRFDLLGSYLRGEADYDNEITEAIIFLDHLMRETPSKQYTQIKKSFFSRGQSRFNLGGAIEAFKGVFSSMRIATSPANKPCLAVTVDVANGTFFTESFLKDACMQMLNIPNQTVFVAEVTRAASGNWDKSNIKTNLKRLSKVHVEVTHRGRTDAGMPNTYVIDKIIPKTAHEHKIQIREGEKVEWHSVADYFRRKYQITVQAGLPLVKMTKKEVYLPMDVCKITQNQRYPFKLNDKQTASMIKFAVTPPKDRWASIKHGLGMLRWEADPVLARYGLQINSAPVTVSARQLPAPTIHFGGNKDNTIGPNQTVQGRWMLVGKKFASPNPQPLKSWGVCVVQGRGSVNPDAARAFFKRFVDVYKRHGGSFANENFVLVPGNPQQGQGMVDSAWNATGNANQLRPQLLFFVVPDRNADTYNNVKKICECRYGVVTQFVQGAHVLKNQDQYHSNVCMKVNAKLGGFTSRATGALTKISPKFGTIPTMCIGADVSHPAPGALKDGSTGSFAALTMSLNQTLTRYAAQCDTNGFRVEMISTANIDSLLGKMVNYWMKTVGKGGLPQRVIYFRDGVSEPQYQHVLEQEVRDIKALFRRINDKNNTQFIVIVASKRHHVRFFPEKGGDRNGNPNPGTLVETGVTHPFQFDFYLCAHSAIKGTARPVHYTVLMNEPKLSSEEIQQLIFEHSFQYIRSTTPVSLFPAVYYAHLASQRARAHASGNAPSSGKKETTEKKDTATSTSEKTPTEVAPITPMCNAANIDFSMWYV